MVMYNPNDLWVTYMDNFEGNTFEDRTKIFTSKEEAGLYQETEKRDSDMSYTVSTLKEYIEYQYESGKEYGEDDIIRNVQFHLG